MPEQRTYNYPDVYGFITSEARLDLGPVQVALATDPPEVQGGRPFEVMMLVQNMMDTTVDVNVNLQPPEKDAKGQKGRFLTDQTRLVVGVQPGEVGYIGIQMSTLPDIAPGDDYTISMEVGAKVLDKKASRLRQDDGGSEFQVRSLPEDRQRQIIQLHRLKFSTKKRGFLRGNALETSFSITPGRVGTPLNLKPRWVSLWTIDDQKDMAPLLEKYSELMRLHTLPKLVRTRVYEPLLEKTVKRFDDAEYPLRPLEAAAVARLMTLVLEYANASNTKQDIVAAGRFNIEPRLADGYEESENSTPLPRWTTAMLKAIARDERFASVPHKAIPHLAYDDLLFDAVRHGFYLIEKTAGENLGTDEEIETYAETLIETLNTPGEMTFSFAYIPLVIGGVIAYDRVMMKDEHLGEILTNMKMLYNERLEELNDDNQTVFELVNRVLTLYLRKYGTLDSRNL